MKNRLKIKLEKIPVPEHTLEVKLLWVYGYPYIAAFIIAVVSSPPLVW